MRLSFSGMDRTVELPGEMLAAIEAAAPNWPHRPLSDERPALSTVKPSGEEFRIEAAEVDPVQGGAVGVACALMVDVAEAFLAQAPSMLSLHCGAIELDGRLLLIPAVSRAGKSTLVARLAAAGHRIWCDDILPLGKDDRAGMALGIAPRIRLPLPACATTAFRSYVADRMSASDGRYAYLGLEPGRLAAHGDMLPLGAVLLLDRRDGAPATLGRASRADALRCLIEQNQVRTTPAGEVLDRLHAVMDRLDIFVLRYSDLEEAVGVIERAFCGWPTTDISALPVFAMTFTPPEEDDGDLEAEFEPVAVDPDAAFLRAHEISLRSADNALFLSGPDGAAVYHLNPVGTAIWNLLEEPTTVADAAEIIGVAFPDIAADRILADVQSVISALVDAELIEPMRDTNSL